MGLVGFLVRFVAVFIPNECNVQGQIGVIILFPCVCTVSRVHAQGDSQGERGRGYAMFKFRSFTSW